MMRLRVKPVRITGSRLQRIRENHLGRNPLCIRCMGKGVVTLARVIDHIIALDNGGKDVEENRQGLCIECHKEKTAEDFGWSYRNRSRLIGADGFPVAVTEERGEQSKNFLIAGRGRAGKKF